MGIADAVAKVTDPYERKARLFPALLATLPVIIMLVALYGPNSAIATACTVAVSCGGLFLLGNIARDRGRRLEQALFDKWGGKPSTQLLRHRDRAIERPTKQRYHKFLSGKIHVNFPDTVAEAANPTLADDVYQSAVRWLLDHTRDKKAFALLFEENITYGFRRNSYALKTIGISCCFLTILWIVIREYLLSGQVGGRNTIKVLSSMSEASIVSLAVACLMLLVWFFFFREHTVRDAAFTYAESLLRACDNL